MCLSKKQEGVSLFFCNFVKYKWSFDSILLIIRMKKKWSFVFLTFIGLLLFCGSQKLHAQCSEIASDYKTYLLTHSLNLDPIEGKWNVSRTVKIYVNNRVVKLYKEGSVQSWLILKKDNHFSVCNDKLEVIKATVFFLKNKKSALSYYFHLTYMDDLTSVAAMTKIVKKRMKISFFESSTKVKEFVKDQTSDNIKVEYDYELMKDDSYVSKITQEVPRIKDFVIKKVKNYFNM